MAKKIKIAHIHVWDKNNKGDVAIVMAVQELLKDYFGSIEILDFPVETLKEFDNSKIKKINSSNIVIVGGGGIFYRYFMPYNKKVIDAIKKPIAIFSTGYIREIGAPKLSQGDIDSIIYLNKKAKLIAVRDYYTKNFLIKGGVPSKKINLIGDSAILLSEKKPNNFKLKKGVNIGLNLTYSGWLGFGHWYDDIMNSYQKTAEFFIKKYNANVYYLKHHPGEDNIHPKLELPLEVIDLKPRQQKYIYNKLDFVVGMMLHSSVMTFGAGTPEVNVAYDIRNKNFAKFIGCPELVIPLEKLKTGLLQKRSKEVFENSEYYKNKFQKKISQIRKKHDDYLEQIEKLIK